MKKLLSKVLLVTMLVSGIGSASIYAASGFSDVPSGVWYEDTLDFVIDEGIIAGYPDGTFRGEEEMTIDQFIKTMVVAIDGEQPLGNSYWASEYIARAIALGIIESDTFSSYARTITRAEMAMIAENTLLELEGKYTYSYESVIENDIEDMEHKIDCVKQSGYEDAVIHMYEQGILLGYPDGYFKAFNGLKRQEAITVVARVVDTSYRMPYEVATYDYSDFPEGIKEAIELIGATPYLTEGGEILTTENAREVTGNGIGTIFLADGYTITLGNKPYTTEGDYSFDMTIDVSDICISDHPEEMLAYRKYMIERHLREIIFLEDDAIEEIVATYEKHYYRHKEFLETYEVDTTKYDVEVLDPYGRTLLVLGGSNFGFEFNIRGLFEDGNPYD